MKNNKNLDAHLTGAVFSNDRQEKEYSLKRCERLILVWRSDAAYLRHHKEPYRDPLFSEIQSSAYEKQFATIKNRQDWLITLGLDSRALSTPNEDACDEAYNCFQLYMDVVQMKFPSAWFGWGVDLDPTASKLFFHMFGSFGKYPSNDQKSFLKKQWLELTGSTGDKDAFRVKRSQNSIEEHLFSQEKSARRKRFSKMFPGRLMFGIAGKQNVEFAKASKALPISADTKLRIEQHIRDKVYTRNGLDSESFDHHVKGEFYHFSFFPKEVVDEVIALARHYKY